MSVQFAGVKEGDDFNYDSIESLFAYCYQPINMYSDKEESVCFRHFSKPSPDVSKPKSGYAFLDHQLIRNLDKMDVISMRPVQIATLMASFFTLPDNPPSAPDFIGVSNTGSGKTLAFLVPMVQKCLDRMKTSWGYRRPLVLIFAHTSSLVLNIYQTALKLVDGTKVKVKLIAGGQPLLRDANFDIGICTVGRFLNHLNSKEPRFVNIPLDDLKYIVMDEADKLVESNEFLRLYDYLETGANNKFSTMLFTATAHIILRGFYDTRNFFGFAYGKSDKVAESVKQFFWQVNTKRDSNIVGTCDGKMRMLDYGLEEVPHPFDALYCFVKQILYKKSAHGKVMVFVNRTMLADHLALRLNMYGFNSVAVHSKQLPYEREGNLQMLISGEVRILIATQLLTRGTDIDVDFIINYDLPPDYSEFVHRCGRTGRNGQIGRAITFVDFNNTVNYAPSVLRQIALKTDDFLFPRFMRDYVKEIYNLVETETKIMEAQQADLEIALDDGL